MSTCENGFSGRTVILSVVGGAVAGATVALLLAPRVRQGSTRWILRRSHDPKGRASAADGAAEDVISPSVS